MRILGLDLSLASTGYALLDDEDVVWYGSVAGGVLRDVERLQHFDRWIRAELRDKRFAHVGIEGYSFASKFSHAHSLGELGGVIKLAVHQFQIPMTVVPPATWKKALCGNGRLVKDQVRLELFKRYGVEFHSQDTVDAWAVAMYVRRQLLGLNSPAKVSSRKRPPKEPATIDQAIAATPGRPASSASA